MNLKERVARTSGKEEERIELKDFYKECIQFELDNMSEQDLKKLKDDGGLSLRVEREDISKKLEEIISNLSLRSLDEIANEAVIEISDLEEYKAKCETIKHTIGKFRVMFWLDIEKQ